MNKNNETTTLTLQQRLTGWLVHAFTASGAYVGLLALLAIYQQKWLPALWLMGIAIVIDAVDGLFARLIQIKMAAPRIDGALLDNIVDFFNYTIVPSFFLLVTPLLPDHWRFACVFIITLSSAYQFTQIDAKTDDHFFKGFPSYWNIAVFYLFFWQMDPTINLIILLVLAVLSFVPIKYVYPSRLDYLADSGILRLAMLVATILWGAATFGLMWVYPESNPLLTSISMGYMLLYVGISLYRTWMPLVRAR
ncbi:MAG TPA: CDP-alcohol phosphatidyltransferase family protein [Gammaproteobacteria bacterium]|nr:CDP-alcohol phosphatidyltransferase family protein [Gammaproteobacteria bacterium]